MSAQWRRKYAAGNARPAFVNGVWLKNSRVGTLVVMIGSNHTRNPNDPLIGSLEPLITDVLLHSSNGLPTIVAPERKPHVSRASLTVPQAVQQFGESGALEVIGHQHPQLELVFLNPDHLDQINYLRSFLPEQEVRHFVIARDVLQHINTLNLDALPPERESELMRMLEHTRDTSWATVPDLAGWYDLRELRATHHALFGRDLLLSDADSLDELNSVCDWDLDQPKSPILKALASFRDQVTAANLEIRSSKSNLVLITGAAHVAPVVRSLLKICNDEGANWSCGDLELTHGSSDSAALRFVEPTDQLDQLKVFGGPSAGLVR